MTHRMWMIAASLVIGFIGLGAGASGASAQVPGFKRTELQKQDLSTPGREAVVARGEFEPGAVIPKHTHAGEELAYLLEGELTVEVEGKPPVKLKVGDTYFVAAGTVHTAKNTGKAKAVVLSTYVVEKGKPLATMVGAPATPPATTPPPAKK